MNENPPTPLGITRRVLSGLCPSCCPPRGIRNVWIRGGGPPSPHSGGALQGRRPFKDALLAEVLVGATAGGADFTKEANRETMICRAENISEMFFLAILRDSGNVFRDPNNGLRCQGSRKKEWIWDGNMKKLVFDIFL